ncbi:MAG: Rieske (2Fe-2S) protein [Planctomycetota bacterium]
MNPQPARWQAAYRLEDLPPKAMKPVKIGGHAIVLIHADDGTIHALDNRCPHEGYAMAQGELDGCVLTCAWHNWKFDIRTGECRLGGEDIRRFPVRVDDGNIEVDLKEPDPKESWPKWLQSLEAGIREPDLGRAVRDAVRLLESGYPPWQLLAEIAAYDARHAEYGTSHALPVAADVGRWMERFEGSEKLLAIAPALEMCIENNQRLSPRKQPTSKPDGDLGQLLTAVESQDEALAEALLLGAFESGMPRHEVEHWLYRACAEHFTDFGHELIYLTKAKELLDHVDDSYAQRIYPALLFSIVLGTREDTLPYMRRYFEPLDGVDWASFEEQPNAASHEALARVTRVALDGETAEVSLTLLEALRAGIPRQRLADALVDAAAERLLRFDEGLEYRDDVAENWLFATHRLTFASAVREAMDRYDSPQALRFLFQSAAFTHSGRGMDADPEDPERAQAHKLSSELFTRFKRDPRTALISGFGNPEAGRSRDMGRSPEILTAAAQQILEAGGSIHDIHHLAQDYCLSEQFVRPIFLAHAIKTWNVGWDESHRLGPASSRPTPLLAALRFLASPLRERRTAGVVKTSIAWVRDGKIPRKLTQ